MGQEHSVAEAGCFESCFGQGPPPLSTHQAHYVPHPLQASDLGIDKEFLGKERCCSRVCSQEKKRIDFFLGEKQKAGLGSSFLI